MTDLRTAAQQALEALELIVQWDEADLILLDHHIERARAAIAAMRAALENEFNPDWDRTEALQENLREHMAEIQRLRATLAEPVQEAAHAARYLFLRDLALNSNALEAFVATQMLDHMRDAQKIDAAVDSAMATSPRRTAGAEGGPAAWGVDWGRDGDRVCVSITKMLPNGSVEIVDTQYEPPGWRQQKTD